MKADMPARYRKKYDDAFRYICEAAEMPYPNMRGRHYPEVYERAERRIQQADSHEACVEIAKEAVKRHTMKPYRPRFDPGGL